MIIMLATYYSRTKKKAKPDKHYIDLSQYFVLRKILTIFSKIFTQLYKSLLSYNINF